MTYETNKKIPSLSEVRKQEREEQERIRDQECKILLLDSISFYDDNYPKSTHDNTWNDPKKSIIIDDKKDLHEMLDECDEETLTQIFKIFDYAHDERFIVSIKDHEKMNFTKAIIRKLVPGGSYIEELNSLKKNNETVVKQIIELEQRLAEDRKKFNQKLKDKEDQEEKKYVCHICGFESANGGGLSSHMRHSHGGT